MNTTNRALNRLFVLVVGVLLLAAGALAVALAAVPAVATQWKRTSTALAGGGAPSWASAPAIGRATPLVLGVIAIAVVLIVLLLVFIAKQGHGRTAAALEQRTGTSVARIDLAVPKALLEQHLQGRPELAGLRITAYEVRATPMLKITARCSRGASPAAVSAAIGDAIRDLEQIVGTDVPAFVQLTGGFRTGSASRPRVA
jgi:hypothetical protein